MSPTRYTLLFTQEANKVRLQLKAAIAEKARYKKVQKDLHNLATDPRHPGLRPKKLQSATDRDDRDIWQSYVENHVASAWRIWWRYADDRSETIIITYIGPHP